MEKEQKIGKGIKIISILLIIGCIISIGTAILGIINYDSVAKMFIEQGDEALLPSVSTYYITLFISALSFIFVVLIMMKNKIGVFGRFGLTILHQVYMIMINKNYNTLFF